MDYQSRYKIILAIFGLGAIVLLSNLFYLQVVNTEYRTKAENRTLTKKILFPPRGNMYDRNGNLLVVNLPTYELQVVYNEIPEDFDKKEFCRLLDIKPEDYDFALQQAKQRHYFRRNLPITLLNDIDPRVYASFQEHLYKYPGFYPQIKNKRYYPYPYMSHVLGYINEVNNSDIESNEDFVIGDHKGASGLEYTYDQYLRGKKGAEYVLKDNLGREVESYDLGVKGQYVEPGANLLTTIDVDIQQLAEELMKNKRGSIVALEPKTGEVLCMVSAPSYNPNLLSFGKERSNTFLGMLTDTINDPLLNRALQAEYPPGSIFKPILALAALQEEVTYPSRSMTCTGEYVLNAKKGFSQGCRDHPHPYNVQTALQWSCNTYFYQLMRDFVDQYGYNNPTKGLDKLNEYLYAFGLGKKLGIDLTNEGTGFVPTSEFYNQLYNTEEYTWRSTYILSLGIGQGELMLTTLQMANLAAIIANKGYYITPHLVQGITGDDAPPLVKEKITLPIDKSHFEVVIDGMFRVVNAGTGRRAFVRGIPICGKTGTAQNPHGEDHSVFFAFAPKDNPQIAVAILVENAGGGSSVAAPLGSVLIEQYLQDSLSARGERAAERLKEINLLEST